MTSREVGVNKSMIQSEQSNTNRGSKEMASTAASVPPTARDMRFTDICDQVYMSARLAMMERAFHPEIEIRHIVNITTESKVKGLQRWKSHAFHCRDQEVDLRLRRNGIEGGFEKDREVF